MQEDRFLRRAVSRLRNVIRPNVEINPPPDGVVLDRDVEVPVRDGTVLRVNIFRPAVDGVHPGGGGCAAMWARGEDEAQQAHAGADR